MAAAGRGMVSVKLLRLLGLSVVWATLAVAVLAVAFTLGILLALWVVTWLPGLG